MDLIGLERLLHSGRDDQLTDIRIEPLRVAPGGEPAVLGTGAGPPALADMPALAGFILLGPDEGRALVHEARCLDHLKRGFRAPVRDPDAKDGIRSRELGDREGLYQA